LTFQYIGSGFQVCLDGTVLHRFENTLKGVIRAIQVAAEGENNLNIAVYGELPTVYD